MGIAQSLACSKYPIIWVSDPVYLYSETPATNLLQTTFVISEFSVTVSSAFPLEIVAMDVYHGKN